MLMVLEIKEAKAAYDVIVVGGGPAGSTAAMYLKKAGKKVLLIDKARFPRDKVCGDAQGRKAAAIMKELGIYEGYKKLPGVAIYGLRLSSPNGKQVDLEMIDRVNGTPGYIVRRMDFDNYLYQSATRTFKVEHMEQVSVEDIILDGEKIKELKCKNLKDNKEFTLKAKIYIGADGAHSVFAKKFGIQNPPDHLIVALRAYYKNVKGLDDKIEIHLIKDLIPGYFWIFPLPNGEANVGLGMITKDMAKKRINLVDALKEAINTNPLFVDRFKDAVLIDEIKAWNLPIASYRRKCYGTGVMLVGDAAGLIDPLSGEGIGTAVISGKIAAQVAVEAMEKSDYSEGFLEKYSKLLWEAIGPEIKADYRVMQLGSKFPFLLDRVIGKIDKNPEFKKVMEAHLPYVEGKEKIGTWGFIKDLLF